MATRSLLTPGLLYAWLLERKVKRGQPPSNPSSDQLPDPPSDPLPAPTVESRPDPPVMPRKMRRVVGVLCLCLGLIVSARAQTISGPPGSYTSTQTLVAPGPVTLTPPWNGAPGNYAVVIPGPVVVTSTPNSITFTWGAGPPVPPGPTPPPPAPVETAHLWVVAVFDTDELQNLHQGQIALHTSTTIKSALKALDADWLEFSTKNPESARFAALISTLPGAIVLKKGPDGKGLPVGDPLKLTDEAAVVSAISKLRGK